MYRLYRLLINKINKTESSLGGHMTFNQCRFNFDATSWRCIDIETTLSQRWVPNGPVLFALIFTVKGTTFFRFYLFCFSTLGRLWLKRNVCTCAVVSNYASPAYNVA